MIKNSLIKIPELKIKHGCLSGILIVLFVLLPTCSFATILTFDQSRDAATSTVVVPTASGSRVQQDYGDNVIGSPMNVLGGQFTYAEAGEGYTPNVTVDYISTGNLFLWQQGYGDLSNVLFTSQSSNSLSIKFTAEAGFEVLLYGFDLAGWPHQDYTINGVNIFSDTQTLFSESNVLVEGDANGTQHTSFDFLTPLAATEITIEIDFSNLAGSLQDNIAIDNIRFGQNPPPLAAVVPEPATYVMFVMALLLLIGMRYKQKV